MRRRDVVLVIWIAVSLALSSQSRGDLYLDYMAYWGTLSNGTPSTLGNDTPPGGMWEIYLKDSPDFSGYFINGANSSINILLEPGDHTYTFVCPIWGTINHDYGVLMLRVQDSLNGQTGFVGVWAPEDTFNAWTSPPSNFFPTTYGPGFTASPTYSDAYYSIEITDYAFGQDGIFGSHDWASPYSPIPDGSTDILGRVSFTVNAVPIPSAVLLGSLGLGYAGWRMRRSKDV